MTPGVDLYRARIIASIAAVVISLACGTNVTLTPLYSKHPFLQTLTQNFSMSTQHGHLSSPKGCICLPQSPISLASSVIWECIP